MPLYEYKCEECGEIKEVLQKFSDSPLERCDSCFGKVYKLISNTSFHLKGTGWYVTDYSKKRSGSKLANLSGAKSKKVDTKGESTSKIKD